MYEISTEIKKEEIPTIKPVIQDLHDTLMAFKQKYKRGRAIAAPQIGVNKRLIYSYVTEPIVYLNPLLHFVGDNLIHLWDDCMSFPDLYVRVARHQKCTVTYSDLNGEPHTPTYENDMSELLQHEYDHLNGILAVSRAVDGKSFCLRSQKHLLPP